MDKRGTNGCNPIFASVYKEKETTFDKSIYLVIASSQLSNIKMFEGFFNDELQAY